MVSIYGININNDIDECTLKKLMNFTSSEKITKIKKYRFLKDSKRTLLGDILARYIICNKQNIPNSQLEFKCNEYGKPELINPSGYYYNISHSGKWVVCAFDNHPIGIDVEVIKPIEMKIAKRFFTESEYNDLMNIDEDDRLKYFYKLWTLKESYIKADGKGLTIPLDSFSFSIENGHINLTTKNEYDSCIFWQDEIDDQHIVSVCHID